MTTLNKINELTTSVAFDLENARETYFEAEATLAQIISGWVYEAKVSCATLGEGTIVETEGATLDRLVVTIAFDSGNKRFSLVHIMNNKFINFTELDVTDIWTQASNMHTEWTTEYKELVRTAEQLAIEAEKKAIAERKAEEKFQKQKDKAIRDFDKLANRTTTLSEVDEFYYALGWLAKHIGTISAKLPDYLKDAFEKTFGSDTPCYIVDSKKRTVNGNSMQWTFGFKATLKKAESMPSILRQYINESCNALTNTSFIWDLISDYGFQFGKKQDVDKIAQTVPAQYIDSFNEGLAA